MGNVDYNFWDDRTLDLDINPCKGCEDYQNGECASDGGCGDASVREDIEKFKLKFESEEK